MGPRVVMFLLPFALIGLSRLAAESSLRLFPTRIAFACGGTAYYVLIVASAFLVRRIIPGATRAPRLYSGARPAAWRLALAIVLPALPLLALFVHRLAPVAPLVVAGVLIFAIVNGTLEEVFWRGVMAHLPAPDWMRILYPSVVFSFMHWFNFLAYIPLSPMHAKMMLVSTFLLGVAWMWFYLREGSLIFPISSHIAINVFAMMAVAMGHHAH